MNPAEHEHPKARSQGLIVEEIDTELLVFDKTAARAHCLNSTAALVWRYCDGHTTVSAMAARLGADTGASVDDDIVFFALSELGDRDLLERPVPVLGRGVLNRRQALVRLATAGILLPMITSLVAPTSVAAQSAATSSASSSGQTITGATSSASSSGQTSEID